MSGLDALADDLPSSHRIEVLSVRYTGGAEVTSTDAPIPTADGGSLDKDRPMDTVAYKATGESTSGTEGREESGPAFFFNRGPQRESYEANDAGARDRYSGRTLAAMDGKKSLGSERAEGSGDDDYKFEERKTGDATEVASDASGAAVEEPRLTRPDVETEEAIVQPSPAHYDSYVEADDAEEEAAAAAVGVAPSPQEADTHAGDAHLAAPAVARPILSDDLPTVATTTATISSDVTNNAADGARVGSGEPYHRYSGGSSEPHQHYSSHSGTPPQRPVVGGVSRSSHLRLSTGGSASEFSTNAQDNITRRRVAAETYYDPQAVADIMGSTGPHSESNRDHSEYSHSHDLHRSRPRSRRRSSTIATLDRDGGALQVHHAYPAMNAVSASPDDIRGYVATLIRQHEGTIVPWEGGIGVTEVYCLKPTRTGGRPAPPRPSDEGFLSRIDRGTRSHLEQLLDAQAILSEQTALYEDAIPVFQSRSAVERQASVANEVWAEECRAMSAQLEGYVSQTRAMRRRVARLRSYSGSMDPYNPLRTNRGGGSGGSPTRRGRSASRHRGSSPGMGSAELISSRGGGQSPVRRGSVQRGDGQLTLANSYSGISAVNPSREEMGASRRGSVYRGSPGSAISPAHTAAAESTNGAPTNGHSTPDHAVPNHPHASHKNSSVSNGRSPTEVSGTSMGTVRRESRRSSVRSALTPIAAYSTPRRRASSGSRAGSPSRPVHPDTFVVGTGEPGSPYDRRTVYGQLSPVRRHSLTQPDPVSVARLQSGLRESSHVHSQLLIDGGANGAHRSETGTPSGSRRDSLAVPSECGALAYSYNGGNGSEAGTIQTALVTYSSPRGQSEPAGSVPVLTEAQRKQLLLTIEYFEKNAAALRKADLKTARDCFVELYGQQRGLRQYCNWVDDLALQALRRNR